MCLNPCCNGTYSPSEKNKCGLEVIIDVLILVVMEHTLRVITLIEPKMRKSLNPCCNGTYSPSKGKSVVTAFKIKS